MARASGGTIGRLLELTTAERGPRPGIGVPMGTLQLSGHRHRGRGARITSSAMIMLAAVAIGVSGCQRAYVSNPTPSAASETDQRRAAAEERLRSDWAWLERYRDENAALGPPASGERRVVFMGNSITEGWAKHFPAMFPGKPYIGRGISGQTTPQMLVRFRQDVIALRPEVVVILAGTNDIAENTGPATLEMIQDNIVSMVELARANRIRVVLSSVLPASSFSWKPELQPARRIVELNEWMKQFARANDIAYVDYHSAMADERQGLRAELSKDGVHPNEAGYRIMAPLVERGIEEALGRKPH